ncbi:MAG: hypothetical protein ACXADY_06940 [Candidatus Hodarchaeales archaeon]|jgi:hypothetical protein
MSSIIPAMSRVPWKEYSKSQIFKIIGFLVLALLIIGVMIVSEGIDLSTATVEDPEYIIAVFLSSICFLLVLIGFSKIVLFDMAVEFGLRDETTDKMVYNARFFLFAALALSFCSAIYLLLDVFLYQDGTYLQLLPVLIMEWVLVYFQVNIPGLTDKIGVDPKEFYQTARNIYFGFFFLIIIAFSVLVFLSILTSLARKRVVSRFEKDETIDEEEENRRLYKILAWFGMPIFALFLSNLLSTPIAPIIAISLIVLTIWWIYQLAKFIFLVFWRGLKITAFITSVNFLLIIPLIGILYLLPVASWVIWDVFFEDKTDLWVVFMTRAFEVVNIIQLDFVFITIIATVIVGFAEGFAIVAIFSAIFKGVEVARSGRIIARSPPKVAVIMKYLIMFSAWLGLFWNSLVGILQMLEVDFEIPSLIYMIYDELILPLSEWFEVIWPTFKYVPFLLLPLYFILAGAFKFLSVTLVTPRVKERLSFFFLLVSTAFVLIITNILGDIYELRDAAVQVDPTSMLYADAPLLSQNFVGILEVAVVYFEYVESVAFYAGFIFGLGWVTRKFIQSQRAVDTVATPTVDPPETTPVESLDNVLSSLDEVSDENREIKDSNDSEGNRNLNNVQEIPK